MKSFSPSHTSIRELGFVSLEAEKKRLGKGWSTRAALRLRRQLLVNKQGSEVRGRLPRRSCVLVLTNERTR